MQTKQKDTSKYVPEGVEGFAKYKGDVESIIYKLIGGLRSSMAPKRAVWDGEGRKGLSGPI